MATGLLPIVLGEATRLIRFLPGSPKHYSGSLRLGFTSDTDDAMGKLLRVEARLPAAEIVIAAAREFEGASRQFPPDYSARRIDGQRLYKLARAGKPIAAEARPIHVTRFELFQTTQPDIFEFVAVVTGGTYVRALARDLGTKLGCGGLLQSLRRSRIGGLDVALAEALPPEADPDWVARRLIPPAEMPLEPSPARLACAEDVTRFRQGRAQDWQEAAPPDGWVRVLAPDGQLLGVGTVSAGVLQPRVVLPG